jgi:hypothetical protein
MTPTRVDRADSFTSDDLTADGDRQLGTANLASGGPGRFWDLMPARRTWRSRLVRSWQVKLAVLASIAAIGLLVGPLILAGLRFSGRLTHPLEDLAKQAQPRSARVFDAGVKADDPNSAGFAFGVSRDAPGALLAASPPARWTPGPAAPETPDTKFYRSGDLLLTVRVDPCNLRQCAPGDVLVYTEVTPTGGSQR